MARRMSAASALRLGSVSALLPLLTVAGASTLADRREALNAPPAASKTATTDCVSTTALLVFRGLGAGLAWTIGVDGYALASMTDAEWAQRVAARPGSSVAREAARSLAFLSMRNMLGFAAFLGIFGGVSCSLEKVRGRSDLLNPFAGGFTAGLAILPGELRNPRALLTAACLCGSASMALHYFIPSGENKAEGVVAAETRCCWLYNYARHLVVQAARSRSSRPEDWDHERWAMRQRRHVNGNSNALAPVEASVDWGSGRSVPANITSTSKRAAPASIVADAVAGPIAQEAVKQEKRSGAATARRPQSGSSRDPLAGYRPKRRVQSARGASDKSNQSSDAAEEATPVTALQSIGDTTLPKLKPQIGDRAGVPTINNRTSSLQRKSAPPTSSALVSGTDATSQVQWAVKVVTTAPAGQTAGPPEPIELLDLRRMLRDRYGEKRSVRQAFLTWDTNKDGRLCVEELRDMLTRLGFAQALGQTKVNAILHHVLATPAASLHYDDFCGFVYGPPVLNQAAARSSFSRQIAENPRAEENIVSASDPDCVVSLLRAKYESRRVHQVFREWDVDKNGGVTMAEIENNLRRQGLRIAKPQLVKLFDTYDLNHDGRLLYDEFMRLVYGPVHEQRYSYLAEQRRKKQQERQRNEGHPLDFFRSSAVPLQTNHSTDDPDFRATLQRKLKGFTSRLNDAYAAFDDDHSGNLSYRELRHGLQELGLNLTEREFLHLATRVDTDGNGEISFKEFCAVFGGGEVFNRRRRSAPTGDEEDERVEERDTCGPKTRTKENSQRTRPAGIFNFSHLTRRSKIPTRCGRTPYTDTKGVISGNQDDSTCTNPARFMTEAQLYGGGSSSRSAPAAKVITTLGQEEKQQREAANANRLQRLRVQMEHYEAQARPLQDSFNVAQERRVRTLQRHQERYQQHIEHQRPRHTLSPARKACDSKASAMRLAPCVDEAPVAVSSAASPDIAC
ncbi:hypothetical protein PHYPSEUDO_008311, partial [Phytophthora pseudosyringae]